jgi:Uma2 family endonuclease
VKSYEAHAPKVVVEVLSRSTREMDRIRKVEEYKRLPTLTAIMLVEPGTPQVLVLRRDPHDAWSDETYAGLDAVVPLADISASLPLRDIYEGVPLEQAS